MVENSLFENGWQVAFTVVGFIWAVCWLMVRMIWPPKYIIKALNTERAEK